ncbi:unnamed protein product [Cuscuta europaea]|uniref:Carbohydrate kinase PfkB domain-containing protein n=1 Tax=Cuscuta europaea TaxID=41803 RepID=A0A9P0ZRW7_CUSEU|nr:unnamed protein product [Cuscuta europaea]
MSFTILSSSCFSLRNSEVSSPPPTVYPLLIKPHFHHFEKSHYLPLFPDYFSLFVNPNKKNYSMSTGAKDALSCRASPSSPSFRPNSGERSGNQFSSPNEGDEDEDSDDEEHDEVTAHDMDMEDDCSPTSVFSQRWDVLGLGQAMVDFSGMVDENFLERLGLDKGTRKVVNHEERGKILRAMDGCSYKAAAGGSLSNSLVALARLGLQPIGGPPLSIAMAGSVGSDPLGGFYRSKLRRANVNFLSTPIKDGTTGTVIVLTTPDAQRTMLAYQGTSSSIRYEPFLARAISKTNILVVEGYLFELPDTVKTIAKACDDARRSGTLIAITASDVSCIERHYDDFWEIVANFGDIVFANSDEARAMCHFKSNESPISAARYLSHFVPLVSVTDGPRGSYIGVKGGAIFIPPSPCMPLDTCGAGDAYASGFLYGMLRGVPNLKVMGTIAAKVASVVVGQQGTRLRVHDAIGLAESFEYQLKKSPIWSADIGSDQISSL